MLLMLLFLLSFFEFYCVFAQAMCYDGSIARACNQLPKRCPRGYSLISDLIDVGAEETPIETHSYCYKIAEIGSWENVIGQCRDPFITGTDSDLESNFQAEEWLRTVEYILLRSEKVGTYWIPIRRSIEGGPPYSHTTYKPPDRSVTVTELEGSRNFLRLDHRECFGIRYYNSSNTDIVNEDCSSKHEGVCLYRHPKGSTLPIQTCSNCGCVSTFVLPTKDLIQHSCPQEWWTHRLIPGRKRCLRLLTSGSSVTWHEAARSCKAQGGQLATLDDISLYSVAYQLVQSAGSTATPAWVGLRQRNVTNNFTLPVFCWSSSPSSACSPTAWIPFEAACTIKKHHMYGAVDQNGFVLAYDPDKALNSYLCEIKVEPEATHRVQINIENVGFNSFLSVHLINPKFEMGTDVECDLGTDSVVFSGQTCDKGLGLRCYQNGNLLHSGSPGSNDKLQVLVDTTEASIFFCEYWFEPSRRLILSNYVTSNFERTYSLRVKLNSDREYDEILENGFGVFEQAVLKRLHNAYCQYFSCRNINFPFVVRLINILEKSNFENRQLNFLISERIKTPFSASLKPCTKTHTAMERTLNCFLESVFMSNAIFSVKIFQLSRFNKETIYHEEVPNLIAEKCDVTEEWGGRIKIKGNGKITHYKGDNIITYNCSVTEELTVDYIRPSFGCPETIETENDNLYRFVETPLYQFAVEDGVCKAMKNYRRKCGGNEIYGAKWEQMEEIPSERLHSLCPTSETDETSIKLKEIWDTLDNDEDVSLVKLLHVIDSWRPDLNHMQTVGSIFQKYTLIDKSEVKIGFEILSKVLNVEKSLLRQSQELFNFTKACCRFEELLSKAALDLNEEEFLYVDSNVAHMTGRYTELQPVYGFAVTTEKNHIKNVTKLTAYDIDNEQDGLIFLPEVLSYSEVVSFAAYPDASLFTINYTNMFTPVYDYSLIVDQGYVVIDNGTVDSAVLGAEIPGKAVFNLEEPVKIFYKRTSNVCNGSDIICAYWNPEIGGSGAWAKDGCFFNNTVENYGEVFDVCLCNHLTAFTRLLPSKKICGQHALILDLISLVGSILSIVCLLLVIFNFIVYKPWKKHIGIRILVSLSFALVCALVLLLVSFHGKGNEIIVPYHCFFVVPLLHYFLLSSFLWMLVEAYHQYEKFVYILPNYVPRFMTKAHMFSWGLPVIPVVIGLIHEYESPLTYIAAGDICWMDRQIFRYVVLIPWVLVMIVNIIVYFMFLKNAVFYSSNLRTNSHTMTASKIRASLFLFTILGLSWTFGILALFDKSLTFSYLFSIFTSLQGVSIFVLTVCKDVDLLAFWALKIGFAPEKLARYSIFRKVTSPVISRLVNSKPTPTWSSSEVKT
ncbi:hypothetical protein QYM36_016372 [Artemia franciscana]|uniref:Uncharacterized protein n=2 Tax=Artemia franciscana TaxID=6661 RepID=A0AA88HF42_ARTSF|nr:hypothetical protein QYM36_016372 [Artemia franciscana]